MACARVEQLRLVVNELHTAPLRDTVSLHRAPTQFDQDGRPRDAEQVDKAADLMFDRLLWWARALREARAARPY